VHPDTLPGREYNKIESELDWKTAGLKSTAEQIALDVSPSRGIVHSFRDESGSGVDEPFQRNGASDVVIEPMKAGLEMNELHPDMLLGRDYRQLGRDLDWKAAGLKSTTEQIAPDKTPSLGITHNFRGAPQLEYGTDFQRNSTEDETTDKMKFGLERNELHPDFILVRDFDQLSPDTDWGLTSAVSDLNPLSGTVHVGPSTIACYNHRDLDVGNGNDDGHGNWKRAGGASALSSGMGATIVVGERNQMHPDLLAPRSYDQLESSCDFARANSITRGTTLAPLKGTVHAPKPNGVLDYRQSKKGKHSADDGGWNNSVKVREGKPVERPPTGSGFRRVKKQVGWSIAMMDAQRGSQPKGKRKGGTRGDSAKSSAAISASKKKSLARTSDLGDGGKRSGAGSGPRKSASATLRRIGVMTPINKKKGRKENTSATVPITAGSKIKKRKSGRTASEKDATVKVAKTHAPAPTALTRGSLGK
jgi:hypothetical protein